MARLLDLRDIPEMVGDGHDDAPLAQQRLLHHWNQAAFRFSCSRYALVWYHAKGHLVAAARLLKQEGAAAFTRWRNCTETVLYQGHALTSAQELEQVAQRYVVNATELIATDDCFRSNRHRMNYFEMVEQSWPMGSGVVESGAKQFKACFSGPGMRR